MNGEAPETGATPSRVEREYARLCERANYYAQSSFDDFKLLAAVGAILAWAPISAAFGIDANPTHAIAVEPADASSRIGPAEVRFIGFMVIALCGAIIGMYDVLKLSAAAFFRKQAKAVEEILEAERTEKGPELFVSFAALERWIGTTHRPMARAYQAMYGIGFVVLPTLLMLWMSHPVWHVVVYAAFTVAVSLPRIFALATLFPKWKPPEGETLHGHHPEIAHTATA